MFRRQLRRNIRLKLRSLGLDWDVKDSVGLFTVHVPPDIDSASIDRVLRGLQQVFGIVWLTCARQLPPLRCTLKSLDEDLEVLQRHLLEIADRQYAPGRTFAVRVNRGNKFLPFQSPALAAHLGQVIRSHSRWDKVDLNNPDVTFHLDLRCAATFIFGEKLPGAGGLPGGTSGRVLALLSGGIDSPVAAYMMAKRGCRMDFIHFSATVMGREEVLESKIWKLSRQLSRYTLGGRLFVVPYVYFDLALMRQKLGYELILFRRFMVRVAERLALQLRARALVTGDNLSQVASQTMTNLVSTSHASDLLVLRPIIAFDKEETIAVAKKIGVYEIAIEPYKDCCALISENPKTRSRHDRLEQLEARAFPDYAKLIDQTLADVVCLEVAENEPAENGQWI